MLEVVLWALLAIIVAGGLCALAVVFLPAGEQIAPALRDEPVWALPPDRGLQADDVDSVRLPVALRGYRFAETDQLLDRLAEELRQRDVELARLRGGGPTYPAYEPATVGDPATSDPSASNPTGGDPAADEPVDDASVDGRVAGTADRPVNAPPPADTALLATPVSPFAPPEPSVPPSDTNAPPTGDDERA